MQELRDAPPESEEVETAVDQVVNGFVFNFETAGQIVSRTMFYLAEDLPQDWLERYVEGVQGVNANSVHNAFASHLRPEDMMILIVGDSERIGLDALREFGPVTHLEIGESR
jgi:zinc protease